MILQPLYENAVKHGVYESIAPVQIDTSISCRGGQLFIVITNTLDPEGITRSGKGIGLKNIQNRLKLLYGRDDLLSIHKSKSDFEVQLMVPQFLQVEI
jgi:two-component system, LytTR family, sensor kinase